jgi:hypothetical protein
MAGANLGRWSKIAKNFTVSLPINNSQKLYRFFTD